MRSIAPALVFSLALALSSAAQAQTNTNGTASAIGGYDSVAYFTDHAAVRG